MVVDVALDMSPASALLSMRGLIVDARLGYPQVLHVAIRDSADRLWEFATQDADWSPVDPQRLLDRSIEKAEIDAETGILRWKLSDGSLFEVRPGERGEKDDPPYWELLTPHRQVLAFGPGMHWQINEADAPVSGRR